MILFLLWLGRIAFAQESIQTPFVDVEKDEKASEWQNYISTKDITIEYRFESCDQEIGYDQEQILIRITNHSKIKIQLNWHLVLYYNKECNTCDHPDEYEYVMVIKPDEIKEGTCSVHSKDYQLKIFSKFDDVKVKSSVALTKFKLDSMKLLEYRSN